MSNRWPTKPLGDLLSFLTSGSRGWAEYYRESGDLFLRIQNVGRNRMLLDDVAFVAAPDTAEARRTLVQSGDVLLSITADLGRTGVVPDGIGRAFINQHLAILRVQNIQPPFLSAYLASPEGQKQVMGRNKHAVKAGLNFEDIRSFQIPQPPLAEQRRIAEVLDRAEALRAKRRAALAELDTLTKSLFLELFGDVAKNDRNWPSERMGDLMKIRRGGSPRPIENYLGGDINWIKIGDGTQGSDIYLERTEDKITRDGLRKTVFLKAGSLIFANCGVSLGFARILTIDGCIHDGWLSFEEIPETRLSKLFLLKALNSITEHFRQIAPAGTQPNLNTGLMKNFRMIIPPISLQREFAGRVTAVEALKTAQRASLAELDALFASLQHRAFRGEL